MAMTQSAVKSDMQPRLAGALQPREPEFEEFRQHIAIEQLVGTEKIRFGSVDLGGYGSRR